MIRAAARLVIVVPPDLVSGFRLAGVSVVSVQDAREAGGAVERLVADERGVIAVYEPFFSAFGPQFRERLQRSVSPVVVACPAGLAVGETEERRARILGMLQQAVGYQVTFGSRES